MWLSWQAAMALAILSAAFGWSTRRVKARGWAFASQFTQELSLVLVLYSIWQILGSLGTVRIADGFAHGRAVFDVERNLHIANEAAIESRLLAHPLWIQACNGYYAIVHVPALAVFLVWLFVRHRERYPRYRNLVALATGICLCIHFIPVAPPRLYPDLGFVDAAKLYGQSVYGTIGQGLSDQMSAMPSVHVAWAVVVGYGAMTISRSRWRWVALAHAVLTVVAVVATANHWWLDGVVAVAIVGAVVAGQWLLGALGELWRSRRATALVTAEL